MYPADCCEIHPFLLLLRACRAGVYRCGHFYILLAGSGFECLTDGTPCAHCHKDIAYDEIADNRCQNVGFFQKSGNAAESIKNVIS